MTNSFTIHNPNFKQEIREKLKGQHFMHLMGFDLNTIEAGSVTGEMALATKHNQQFGYVHGGVTATILDITMGFAAYTLTKPNHGVVTANLSIDFIKPGEGETIHAEGWVTKPGSRFFFCQGIVYTVKEGVRKNIASATSVMAVVRPPKK